MTTLSRHLKLLGDKILFNNFKKTLHPIQGGILMIKRSYRSLLLGSLALMLTACSGGETDETGSVENEGNNQEVESTESGGDLSGEVEFMTIALLPTFEDYFNDLIDEFEEMHPEVNVTLRDIPFDQVEQVILTSASGGTLPDVMNLNTEFVKTIGATGALANMDEHAADVKDVFHEGLWETGEVNGNVYALPWYTSNGGLLYNPEILEAAGFTEPPATYEEAWEMSAVIFEETGAYGEVILPDFWLMLPKNGIEIVNEEGTEAAFNTPEAVELWTSYKESYEQGLFPIDIMMNQIPMAELYAQEGVAWWATGPSLFRQVRDLSPEVYEKSEAAPPLEGAAGRQHANPMNIAVADDSDAFEAAMEFAKFLTNDDNQVAFAESANVLSSTKASVDAEYFQEYAESEDVTQRGTYYSQQALEDAINMTPPVDSVSAVNEVIHTQFQRVLIEGLDPAQALEEAEQQVNDILANE